MSASIRQDIIRYITDRPDEVVCKEDIMAHGDWNATQVTQAILSVQRGSSLGDEIETIVRGNVWRYRPRSGQGTAVTVEPAPNVDLPVTTLIREFLILHAHEVVTVEHLMTYTGRRLDQVKAGINNMRNIAANADVTAHIQVVVHGKMWRFDPPDNWRPGLGVTYSNGRGRPSTVTHSIASGATTVPTLPTLPTDDRDDDDESSQGRVFEEIGSLRDGRVVIRDENDNMYAATLTMIKSS